MEQETSKERISTKIAAYALELDGLIMRRQTKGPLIPDAQLKYLMFQIDELSITALEQQCTFDC